MDRHTYIYKHTHTHTERSSTVTLAVHVHQGLATSMIVCLLVDGCKTELVDENCHASETVEAREQALMLLLGYIHQAVSCLCYNTSSGACVCATKLASSFM